MRGFGLLFSLSMAFTATAQNWALLNPAYRYNYSNDGTDTISNQIRVMAVDTLGVDSIRYTLNLIGVVCDTCPASLGGPCDGCFVWVDQAQFTGYDCMRVGHDWHFNGRDTFLLRTNVEVGGTWPWNPDGTTTATVDAEWGQQVLGVNDTLRRILLSTGDTVLLSRSFGIVRFAMPVGGYQLIGVEGAGVGRVFPDPLAYFDFDVGDELTYSINSVRWTYPAGAPFQYPVPYRYHWKVSIQGRIDLADTTIYTTSVAYAYGDPVTNGWLAQEPVWPQPQNTWSFYRSDVLADHPILDAYPGQVLDTSICALGSDEEFAPRYLVRSGVTSEGRTIMRSAVVGQSLNGPSGGFNAALPALPGLLPFLTAPLIDVHYEEGIGIWNVESVYSESFFASDMGVRVRLVGAVIGGDTLITPPSITWTVGMEESSPQNMVLYPNPADHTCFISGLIGS